MRHPSTSTLLAAAVEAARAAGDYALAQAHRRSQAVQRHAHDVKLRLDIECQAIATRCLRRRFPTHRILGEEQAGDSGSEAGEAVETRPGADDEHLWIIDPIDGTVNYSHGFPFWCCSIAVQRRGHTLAGAVYAPRLGQLYTATLNGPARRNGERLRVSSARRLGDALVMTGLDQRSAPRQRPYGIFLRLAERCQRARVVGCAALDLCSVAAGQADGYFESGIYLWDVAAAALIVERAGGRTELLERRPDGRLRFLGSNGHLHAALRRLILKATYETANCTVGAGLQPA